MPLRNSLTHSLTIIFSQFTIRPVMNQTRNEIIYFAMSVWNQVKKVKKNNMHMLLHPTKKILLATSMWSQVKVRYQVQQVWLTDIAANDRHVCEVRISPDSAFPVDEWSTYSTMLSIPYIFFLFCRLLPEIKIDWLIDCWCLLAVRLSHHRK